MLCRSERVRGLSFFDTDSSALLGSHRSPGPGCGPAGGLHIVRVAGRVRLEGVHVVSASPDAGRTSLPELQRQIGVQFADADLLRTALTHSSYANEHPDDAPETNERLEFLGDAALGLVVAESLYARYPQEAEGQLTEWRAQLVMGPTLAGIAEALGLGDALLLGRGEEATGGRERDGNLERAYEALLGALLLDQGLEAVRAFVDRTLAAEFDAIEAGEAVLNPKGELQQLTQGESERPEYVVVAQQGPEHHRTFTVDVRLGDETVGSGSGASKQLAEKQAARVALATLRERSLRDNPAGA